MNTKWEIPHMEMLNEIVRSWNMDLPELEKVEEAFKIALDYWHEVKKKLNGFVFGSKDEEIKFYKYIKPKFTSYIEYFILLNHGLLFIPNERDETLRVYWEHEAKRLNRFIERNFAFVEYFKSENNEHDHQYFLSDNYDLANYIVSRPYDVDGEFMSSHDHLVASLLAEEMYHEYVVKKLKTLPQLPNILRQAQEDGLSPTERE